MYRIIHGADLQRSKVYIQIIQAALFKLNKKYLNYTKYNYRNLAQNSYYLQIPKVNKKLKLNK